MTSKIRNNEIKADAITFFNPNLRFLLMTFVKNTENIIIKKQLVYFKDSNKELSIKYLPTPRTIT
jgi:hypothetical protein